MDIDILIACFGLSEQVIASIIHDSRCGIIDVAFRTTAPIGGHARYICARNFLVCGCAIPTFFGSSRNVSLCVTSRPSQSNVVAGGLIIEYAYHTRILFYLMTLM